MPSSTVRWVNQPVGPPAPVALRAVRRGAPVRVQRPWRSACSAGAAGAWWLKWLGDMTVASGTGATRRLPHPPRAPGERVHAHAKSPAEGGRRGCAGRLRAPRAT